MLSVFSICIGTQTRTHILIIGYKFINTIEVKSLFNIIENLYFHYNTFDLR